MKLGKEFSKRLYKLVDTTNKEELEAALAALELGSVEVETEEVEIDETKTEPNKFGSVVLEDGETVIYFPGDTLERGSLIYTDEELTELVGAGEWPLENGDTLVTDEASELIDILPAGEPEAEDEAPEGDDEEAEEVALQSDKEEILEAVGILFTDMENKFGARIDALEGLFAAQSEELDAAKEDLSKSKTKVEELAAMPAAQPLSFSKEDTNKPKKGLSKFDRLVQSGKYTTNGRK